MQDCNPVSAGGAGACAVVDVSGSDRGSGVQQTAAWTGIVHHAGL